jgi:hypothetical protein
VPEPSARALVLDHERWLGTQIPLVPGELAKKHEELAANELRFLRGTFPLWLVRAQEEIPELAAADRVPAVGDIHVENFGTWRDRREVRRWGVNDFDELTRASWKLDLVRLATSACVAPHIALPAEEICATLLAEYAAASPRGAVDLSEAGAGHLRHLVPPDADEAHYYGRLASGPPVVPPAAVAAAAVRLAPPGWRPVWHRRVAGTGSLGHIRIAGVGAAADGRPHAREMKQLGPVSALWAAAHGGPAAHPAPGLYDAVRTAIDGPGGTSRTEGWQIRDLAPDVVSIELSGLDPSHAGRLLRSMARALVDVHGSTGALPERSRLAEDDFVAAVHTMRKRTKADFESF